MILSLSILAQGRFNDVEPGYIRDWLIVAGCLGGLVLLVLTIREKLKDKQSTGVTISPDPLQVQEVETLATRSELAAMGASLEADIEALKKAIDGERNVARVANGTIHKRIDEVVETLAETKGLMTGVKDNTDLLLSMQLGKTTKG